MDNYALALEILVIFALIGMIMYMHSNHERKVDQIMRRWTEAQDEWNDERKDLLDRIQAPTFAEYANKVVREKKAEQPQEEEKEVEFVS